MRVLELRGYKSYRAFQSFHKLMLGLKMLPLYMREEYQDFYARIEEMDEASQEKMIREAVLFVDLEKEEVEALICFCADANGVPYTKENFKELGPKDFHEIMVRVCVEISKIKIDLVSETEKKNSNGSALTSVSPS